MNNNKEMQKKSLKEKIDKHFFLILSLIVLVVLAIGLISLIEDNTITNDKTNSVVSPKDKSANSAEVVPATEIPVEDEVINPPAPPTE